MAALVAVGQVPGEQKEASASESWCYKKNSFLLQVRLLALLHLSLLFRKVLRSGGREEVAVIAVMPQFSKGIPITVYLYVCLDFSYLEV